MRKFELFVVVSTDDAETEKKLKFTVSANSEKEARKKLKTEIIKVKELPQQMKDDFDINSFFGGIFGNKK